MQILQYIATTRSDAKGRQKLTWREDSGAMRCTWREVGLTDYNGDTSPCRMGMDTVWKCLWHWRNGTFLSVASLIRDAGNMHGSLIPCRDHQITTIDQGRREHARIIDPL